MPVDLDELRRLLKNYDSESKATELYNNNNNDRDKYIGFNTNLCLSFNHSLAEMVPASEFYKDYYINIIWNSPIICRFTLNRYLFITLDLFNNELIYCLPMTRKPMLIIGVVLNTLFETRYFQQATAILTPHKKIGSFHTTSDSSNCLIYKSHDKERNLICKTGINYILNINTGTIKQSNSGDSYNGIK